MRVGQDVPIINGVAFADSMLAVDAGQVGRKDLDCT